MIYIDGDSSPIKELCIEIAKRYQFDVTIYIDDSHQYESSYATVITVSQGKDSVDFYILNVINNNDILITDDYALASLALLKKVIVITSKGLILNNQNIELYLSSRFENQKLRKITKHIRGPKKRNNLDNINFRNTLENVLKGWCYYPFNYFFY